MAFRGDGGSWSEPSFATLTSNAGWGTTGCGDPSCVRIKLSRNTIRSAEMISVERFLAKAWLDHKGRQAPGARPARTFLWIGIGGIWPFGPVAESCGPCSGRASACPFHFFDNVDPQGFSRTLTALADSGLQTTLVSCGQQVGRDARAPY